MSAERWLAFNAGSTFGITGRKWILAANAAVTTIVSSFAGCVFAVFYSLYETEGKIDVLMIINGILGALVGVTGGCAVVTPRESVWIGIVGRSTTRKSDSKSGFAFKKSHSRRILGQRHGQATYLSESG